VAPLSPHPDPPAFPARSPCYRSIDSQARDTYTKLARNGGEAFETSIREIQVRLSSRIHRYLCIHTLTHMCILIFIYTVAFLLKHTWISMRMHIHICVYIYFIRNGGEAFETSIREIQVRFTYMEIYAYTYKHIHT